jgi:HEAT repeat protein
VAALTNWGISSLPELTAYAVQSDPEVRKLAATTIGQTVAGRVQPGTQQAIQTLDRLRQDSDPTVRQAAVEALSQIQSDKVIPLLRQSLRDRDLDVVQAASAAVNRFKFYPKPGKLPKKGKSGKSKK